LTGLTVRKDLCSKDEKSQVSVFSAGAVSQSQFFVFLGVVCFFYIIAALAVYLFAWPMYENDRRFALGDFVITAVLAVLWFISSCAWASGVTLVKGVTESGEIIQRLETGGVTPCINKTADIPHPCKITSTWNYASLNVSLIAGFACFGLWAANLWFIYKETAWYKARAAPPTSVSGPGPMGSQGPSGGNTFR